MRKIIVLSLAAISLMACQNKEEKGYTINGELQGNASSGKVYLEYAESIMDEPQKVDSAIVSNGKFELKGKVDQPALYYLVIDLNKPGEEPDLRDKMFRTMMYLDNSDISYKGDVATLPGYYYSEKRKVHAPEIEGSPTHSLYVEMNKNMKPEMDSLRILENKYVEDYYIPQSEGKDASLAGIEIAKQEERLKGEIQRKTLDFIKNNPSSIVALNQAESFLMGVEMSMSKAQIEEMLGWLKKDWENTPQYKELQELANAAIPMALGQHYQDIDVIDREGNTVKLSSLIPQGQYVMLEFWASWCGPCRGEIPHLREIHKKYKDFAIVSVSVDDSEKDWLKALKEEDMSWTQARLIGGISGKDAKVFNIQAVPMCLILDKNGCYYRSNMRGAYLDAFLQEIYK